MKRAIALVFLTTLIATPVLGQKFRSDDPLWTDNDSAVDVKGITKHKLNDQYDFLLHTFGKPGDMTKRRAMNVNTLGEVPNSNWFTNRHAAMKMSTEELVRGPNTGTCPSMDAPWVV